MQAVRLQQEDRRRAAPHLRAVLLLPVERAGPASVHIRP
jgi:hypothetical protein